MTSTMLKNRQESSTSDPKSRETNVSSQYGITRGADYFRRNGGGGDD
jgi:hypothetical protein